MPLQSWMPAVVAGLFAAVLGFAAVLDGLDRFNQGRTPSAVGLFVLGLGLMAGGLGLAVIGLGRL